MSAVHWKAISKKVGIFNTVVVARALGILGGPHELASSDMMAVGPMIN